MSNRKIMGKANMFKIKNSVNYADYKSHLEEQKNKELDKDLNKLGIAKNQGETKYSTIRDLLNVPPQMVLVESLLSGTINVDHDGSRINKGDVLCMNYNSYARSNYFNGARTMKPHKKKFSRYFKRYRGQNLNNKSLLIWRLGGIGDIMFSQPIVRYLKSKYPRCKISFATAPGIVQLLKCWPKGLLNREYSIPFRKKVLVEADYHMTFEGAIEACREAEKVDAYEIFRMVSQLDFNIKDYPPILVPKQDSLDRFKQLIPKNTIIVQMRASSEIRTMQSSKWAKIIKRLLELNYNVGVIDHPKVAELYDLMRKEYKIPELINLATNSIGLVDNVAAISLSEGVLAIDSSMTHIAGALDKPVFGMYGPFSGKLRLNHYKYSDWYDSDYNECGKRPCFYHQHDMMKCPFVKKQLPVACMSTIDVDKVVDKFHNLMCAQKTK